MTGKGARIGITLLASLGLALLALCLPPVQTSVFNLWARHSRTPVSVERIHIGLWRFEVADLNVRNSHGRWRFPHVSGDYSLSSLLEGELRSEEVSAEGWSFISWEESSSAAPAPLAGDEVLRTGAERLRNALSLPFPVSIGRFSLKGEWREHALMGHDERTHVKVEIRGSLGTGRGNRTEGTLWALTTTPDGQRVELTSRGTLQTQFSTPRRIDRLVLSFTASATGSPFPNGAVLSSRLDLRANEKDTALDLFVYGSGDSDARELIAVRAGNEVGTGAMKGRWSIDLNQTDLAPYVLGFQLPRFSVRGSGAFAFDRALRVAGDAEGELGELRSLPFLARLQDTSFRGVFDAAWDEGVLRAHRFSARCATSGSEFAVQLLQPFAWTPGTAPVAQNPEGDGVLVEWRQVDSSFASRFVPIPVTFGRFDGGAIVGFRDGALQGRVVRPVVLPGFSANLPGGKRIDGTLALDGRFAWRSNDLRGELNRIELTTKGGRLLGGLLQASFVEGAAEPRFTINLQADADLVQACHLGLLPIVGLSTGVAQLQLTVSGSQTSWQSQTEVRAIGLTTASGVAIPRIQTSVRLDRNDNGSWDAEFPLVLGQGKEASELNVLCHFSPVQGGASNDAILTSKRLRVDHLQALRSLLVVTNKTAGAAPGNSTSDQPFWGAYAGRLRLGLEQVIWPDRPDRLAVQLEARVSEQSLLLDTLRLEHEQGGNLRGKGEIHFRKGAANPYPFAALLEAKEFDPAPYLRFLDPNRAAVVEGKFDVEIQAKGEVASLEALLDRAEVQVNLTGRGGVFHAFDASSASIDLSKIPGGNSTISSIIGLASSLIGKQDRRVAAGNAFLRRLANLNYDQATFELIHRPGSDTVIREFSLIAPELRLRGEGVLQANSMVPWTQRYMRLQLDVGARGQSESELRTLGLISGAADSLGYFSIGKPLRFEGTLRDLGTAGLLDLIVQSLVR